MADQTYTAVTAANGRCTVTVKSERRTTWIVSQVSSEMSTAPVGCQCTLRKNTYFVTALIATGDTAGGPPPVRLLPSDVLTVEWTGATPGDVGKVLVFYDLEG